MKYIGTISKGKSIAAIYKVGERFLALPVQNNGFFATGSAKNIVEAINQKETKEQKNVLRKKHHIHKLHLPYA